MANPQHLEVLNQGVKAWNKWREQHFELVAALDRIYINGGLSGTNLRGANFANTDFSWTNLSKSNLSKANLSSASLVRTNFQEANLSEANLSKATLNGAFLQEAILKNSILREANLSNADLRGADLSGADLSGATLYEANLSGTQLNGANLEGVNLTKAILDRTNLIGANLTSCSVYGISAWKVELAGATQLNLVITPKNEPAVKVDNLEVAQFIYLLLNYKKLRDMLNSVTERGVLLLGRFSDGGLELLHSIAAKLREMNYLPMIFDFDRPDNRNYTETVMTLVGLSRFVIVDLSAPSVPQELNATIPNFKIPFVPILQEGRKTYSMFLDLLDYPWVIKPIVSFVSEEHLIELLPSRVIAPAEEKFKERQVLLNQLFNR